MRGHRCKYPFTSIYFDITLNGIQNFIEKYQHMSTLQAIDICHVQRCAARQNFNVTSPSQFV